MSMFKRLLVVTALAGSLLLAGTAAYAIVTVRSGSITDQQQFVHDTNPFTTGSAAFVTVPTSWTSMTITSPHMFDARFTAESRCAGNVGWCSVRIILVTPAGVITELDPVVGTDFAFDSAPADTGEGHAVERTSAVMAPGSYRFGVQVAVVGGATAAWLDDWTFTVGAVRP
jgi:hypothetical protein